MSHPIPAGATATTGTAPANLADAIITTSRAAIAAAFERWEIAYRTDPAEFMTEEEVRAMATAPLADRSAVYFIALLRSAA